MNRAASGIIRRLSRFLLIVDLLHVVAYARFMYFCYVRRSMIVARNVSDGVAENTIMHNMRGMRRSLTRVSRSNVLIRPLSVIHHVQRDLVNLKVLSIGPRSEAELLSLMAYGFSWQNIRGVDLMSYSPRIDIGDMHDLRYADNSFDVVIASRVLGYSNSPMSAAAEMLRVVRDRGFIAINTGDLQSGQTISTTVDYKPGSDVTFSSLDDLLHLFSPHVDQVYFRNDPSQESGAQRGPLIAIFSVTKRAP